MKECPHRKYQDKHCAELDCWNYFSKCPKHSKLGKDVACTQDVEAERDTPSGK